MAFKVSIKVGSGKNMSRVESTPLPNKERVTKWVKEAPIGNYKTKVSVEDLESGKTTTNRKVKFYNPKNW